MSGVWGHHLIQPCSSVPIMCDGEQAESQRDREGFGVLLGTCPLIIIPAKAAIFTFFSSGVLRQAALFLL